MDLVRLAEAAEDVASALHTLRDELPRAATKITAAIAQLYTLSSVLRELDDAQGHPRHSPSFYRVQDDLDHLEPSLKRTLQDVLDMFARSNDMPLGMVWDDLAYKLEREEGVGLVERLKWYRDFLRAQVDILNGYDPTDLRDLRRRLRSLWTAQRDSDRRLQRRLSQQPSSPSTPRPGPSRRMSQRSQTPISPRTQTPISPIPIHPPRQRVETPIFPVPSSDEEDGYHNGMPPPVPDPPNVTPHSPTFTSSSSNTLNSSQTSHSIHEFMAMNSTLVHWAQDVFDGENPKTLFQYRAQHPSFCDGSPDPNALHRLSTDGYIQALELSFDAGEVLLRLYFRPRDSRARVFIITRGSRNQELHYCMPLTDLKIHRDGCTLYLCERKDRRRVVDWARLNFVLYERMVLFYCTFVAMKRQDRRGVAHDILLDDSELSQDGAGEVVQFGGVIKDGHFRHALRLFKDTDSGVVRLEASAYRGPMQDVPLWTAFITKYADDPAWAELLPDGRSTVSLAALKPPPYVFLSGYHPLKRRHDYILQFDKRSDAQYFIEVWTGLCQNG